MVDGCVAAKQAYETRQVKDLIRGPEAKAPAIWRAPNAVARHNAPPTIRLAGGIERSVWRGLSLDTYKCRGHAQLHHAVRVFCEAAVDASPAFRLCLASS